MAMSASRWSSASWARAGSRSRPVATIRQPNVGVGVTRLTPLEEGDAARQDGARDVDLVAVVRRAGVHRTGRACRASRCRRRSGRRTPTSSSIESVTRHGCGATPPSTRRTSPSRPLDGGQRDQGKVEGAALHHLSRSAAARHATPPGIVTAVTISPGARHGLAARPGRAASR